MIASENVYVILSTAKNEATIVFRLLTTVSFHTGVTEFSVTNIDITSEEIMPRSRTS